MIDAVQTIDESCAELVERLSQQCDDGELQASARKIIDRADRLAAHRQAIERHTAFAERLLHSRQAISSKLKTISDHMRDRERAESADILEWAARGGPDSPPIDGDIPRAHDEVAALLRASEFTALAQQGAARESARLTIELESLTARFEMDTADLLDAVVSRAVAPVLPLQNSIEFQGGASRLLRESAAQHSRTYETLSESFRRDWLQQTERMSQQ